MLPPSLFNECSLQGAYLAARLTIHAPAARTIRMNGANHPGRTVRSGVVCTAHPDGPCRWGMDREASGQVGPLKEQPFNREGGNISLPPF